MSVTFRAFVPPDDWTHTGFIIFYQDFGLWAIWLIFVFW